MAESAQRGQRNFLGDFEALLKAVSLDYVDCTRYETSGYAEFIGKLYTMNPAMFQSPIYCDHVLTQMALHYLAWFQDPAIHLEVGPGAAWHVDVDAWKLQRYGNVLYVLAAPRESGVARGDRIVAVNGYTLEEIRPEVERVLRTTVEPADPEREDWSCVLAFAKHVTVMDEKGVRRDLVLVPGESAVTGRMREVYAKRGQAAAVCFDAAEVNSPRPPCSLSLEGGLAVLRLCAPGQAAFADELHRSLADLGVLYDHAAATRLIGLVIDVRGACGGTQEDIYPAVAWLLAPGTTATPADLFGRPGIVLNCSRHNVDAKLSEFETVRKEIERSGDAQGLAVLDELAGELAAKRGQGLVCDESDFYPQVTFASAQPADGASSLPVVVLADRGTSDAAEWLVRAAKSAGYAYVAGRATRGSIDNTCPRTVRLDKDFSLTFPTARYAAAVGAGATLGRGIAPDVHIAWTPEQLIEDVELRQAMGLLAGKA